MTKEAFLFHQWKARQPVYILKSWDESKLIAAEKTWANVRSKGLRTCLIATFGGGWVSVLKEASKQSLQYGGRKALGVISCMFCGYVGSASVVLITKSMKVIRFAKQAHAVCAGGFDVAELCAAAPIHICEIFIFGRPVVFHESKGFNMFCDSTDPVNDFVEAITENKK